MIDTLHDIEAVVDDHTGLSRTVLQYTLETKRTVDRAKAPGFDEAAWESLGSLVAIDDFVRVGPFKDVMTWPEYVAFLTGWAPNRHWECSFRRITETGNLVYLELEERSEAGNPASAANSLSVYEFDDSAKLRRLDVYLQMPMPPRPT
jgi:hypothetical protein